MAGVPLLLPSDSPWREDSIGPRRDYELLASRVGADVLMPTTRTRWEQAVAYDKGQADSAIARAACTSVYVSFSERIGIPLGRSLTRTASMARPAHICIAHRLDTSRKRFWQRLVEWQDGIDLFVVLCEAQAEYLRRTGAVEESRIRVLSDSTDTQFWSPETDLRESDTEPFVLMVGRESRDWKTARRASRMAGVRLVEIGNSAWNVRGHGTRHSYPELRAVCRRASAIVVAIRPGTNHAAGVNALLEAMALGRPVVVTRTPGLSDYLCESAQWIVDAGDFEAMAHALLEIVKRKSSETEPHVRRSREIVQERHTVEAYVDSLASLIVELKANP